MSVILNLDTATKVCSVTVSYDNQILFEKENTDGPSHASLLGVFVAEALNHIRSKGLSLHAVAVSCGPGSYTGLRIGVAEAKGLCYGLNIPLIAIGTLQILTEHVLKSESIDGDVLLCPMIDARRMEVYAAIYNNSLDEIRGTRADIVDSETYISYLNKGRVFFFGDGATKCRDVINHPNAIFIDNIYPSARDMVALSNKAFINKQFVDIAYFEPFYLKDFVATTPKKNIL